MMEKMGMCNWISWLIGLVAAIVVYVASVAAVTWIPALLIAIAVGCFLGLVLSHLVCGGGAADEAEAQGAAGAGGAGAGDAEAEAEAQARAVQEAMAAEEAAADAKAAEEAKAAAEAASTPDYDGDGVLEGEGEGTRPEALSGPRGGQADNLKEIKGIGPKLEILCNELGFYHFDQIAGWSADEIAWVNANLTGFKGRVSRDNWVEQAKILAAGGETEFSQRVEDGDVY